MEIIVIPMLLIILFAFWMWVVINDFKLKRKWIEELEEMKQKGTPKMANPPDPPKPKLTKAELTLFKVMITQELNERELTLQQTERVKEIINKLEKLIEFMNGLEIYEAVVKEYQLSHSPKIVVFNTETFKLLITELISAHPTVNLTIDQVMDDLKGEQVFLLGMKVVINNKLDNGKFILR